MAFGLVLAGLVPGAPAGYLPLSQIPGGLKRLEPAAFLNLALLCLMVTPLARVATSIAASAVARDWTFCALTAAVFLVLVLSLILGVS